MNSSTIVISIIAFLFCTGIFSLIMSCLYDTDYVIVYKEKIKNNHTTTNDDIFLDNEENNSVIIEP